MEHTKCLAALEALLFAAGEPLSVAELADHLQIAKPQTWELLTALKESYSAETRGLCLREVAEGFQLVTKPEFYELLQRLAKTKDVKLSTAAMETLAIVALKQPVTRAEIEAVRGVNSDSVVNTLMDLDLLKEAGRKQALGKPLLYVTTERFLTVFGLPSLEALPEWETASIPQPKQGEEAENSQSDPARRGEIELFD